MFVAKVGIALACGWASYVLLDHIPAFMPGGDKEITSTWLVVLVTIFFAYAVAGAFMTVLDLTIDAVLVCYVTVRRAARCAFVPLSPLLARAVHTDAPRSSVFHQLRCRTWTRRSSARASASRRT